MDLLKTDLRQLPPEQLVEAAVLFQSNYKKLLENYEHQKSEMNKFANELSEFKQMKIDVDYQNAILKKIVFGKKSEKLSFPEEEKKSQAELFPEKKDKVSEREPQKRANSQNLDLVIAQHAYDQMPECKICSSPMREMKDQWEKSTEITVIERRFLKKEHWRQKYDCPTCHSNITTAPGPAKLKKGNSYSPDFAVQVAIDKYADHLPLHRQSQIMKRQGLEVKPVTLWNQLESLADVLHPVYKRLHSEVKKASLIHADETSWKLLKNGGKNWWVWGLRSGKACYYKIHESRSGKVPQKLLSGFKGTLLVDGYGGYNQVSLESGIQRAYCWAHVRRKFFDLYKDFPQETEPILKKIALLYHTESTCNTSVERLEVRLKKTKNIVAEIKDLIFALYEKSLPKSIIRKACAYAITHWDGLILFLNDGEIPLDNNKAENSLRNPVIGRKNHLGSKSDVGAFVTSIFYTILESCKINSIDPQAYLKDIVPQLLEKVCDCETPHEVSLPHEWTPCS